MPARSDRRRIEALQALAARPGTPAEGEVAKQMLERHRKARSSNPLIDYLRGGDIDEFVSACIKETRVASQCACVKAYNFGGLRKPARAQSNPRGDPAEGPAWCPRLLQPLGLREKL